VIGRPRGALPIYAKVLREQSCCSPLFLKSPLPDLSCCPFFRTGYCASLGHRLFARADVYLGSESTHWSVGSLAIDSCRNGFKESWIGYESHFDVADGQIAFGCIVLSTQPWRVMSCGDFSLVSVLVQMSLSGTSVVTRSMNSLKPTNSRHFLHRTTIL
jgi:hypothetical protein